MTREEKTARWYEFACSYVDMNWPDMAGKSRMGIAETLATVTSVLVAEAGRPEMTSCGARSTPGRSTPASVRAARRRRSSLGRSAGWNQLATGCRPRPPRGFACRARRRSAAGSTASRPQPARAIGSEQSCTTRWSTPLNGSSCPANPLTAVRVRTRRAVEEVDRRVVVNPEQAARLLAAVGQQGKSGKRLVAFFGLMYYAALRPGEAAHLPASALHIPTEGWGELFLPGSAPTTGAAWSDSGRRRDERGLKHRAREAIRVVPAPPPLTALLRAHLEELRRERTRATVRLNARRVTATSRTASTGGCGRVPAPPRSRRRRPPHRSRAGRTTYATQPSRRGSTRAYRRRRWRSGPATASPSCCGSTPSASPAKRRPRGTASRWRSGCHHAIGST